jgi:hypothetical protein
VIQLVPATVLVYNTTQSVFSDRLGDILDVPVVHLDPIFWSNEWVKTPVEKVEFALHSRIRVLQSAHARLKR